MSGNPAFSIDYWSARARFRAAALARGFRLETHSVSETEDLTVDVAFGGDENPARLVIISSGLHGVEGFLGSAIQVSILEDDPQEWPLPGGVGLVLMHSLDPFGYAYLRRSDVDSVDLNRNFLIDGDSYSGSPPTYFKVDPTLNPRKPPGRFDLLALESIPAVLLHGMAELKRAIAGGQYDFPKGLFFGGKGPSAIRRLLESHMPRWIGRAEYVIHLDIHTGLGRWGNLALLLEDTVTRERARWLAERFGPGRVEWSDEGISYPTRGGLGTWCQWAFSDRVYDFLCAEFGTYSGPRVIAALRAENRAYHWGQPDDPSTRHAKRRILEAFAPADLGWRAQTLAQGREMVRKAFEICYQSAVMA